MALSAKEAAAVSLAYDILNFVNDYGCDTEAFAEAICNGHRTLQQSVMRLIVAVIERMAVNGFDERNQAAVNLARRLSEVAEQYSLPYI